MQKWEYHRVRMTLSDEGYRIVFDTDTARLGLAAGEYMTELGDEGWELVSVSPEIFTRFVDGAPMVETRGYALWFKRPKG